MKNNKKKTETIFLQLIFEKIKFKKFTLYIYKHVITIKYNNI